MMDAGTYETQELNDYREARNNYIGANIAKRAAQNKWNTIQNESAEKMKERLDAYKKAKDDKFKQSQMDGKSAEEQAKVVQEQSSIRNWLKTATVEEIDTKYEETKAELDEKIQEFDAFVESIDVSTQLGQDLRKALNKANALAEVANNSTSTKVRALSLYIDQFLKQYEGAENEQAKESLNQLQILRQILRNYNMLSDEAAARRFRHKIEGKYNKKGDKPMKVDTKTYVDEEGNIYTVDLDKSTYSESEGLNLAVVKKRPNTEKDRETLLKQKEANDKALDGLQKQLDRVNDQINGAKGNAYTALMQYRDTLNKDMRLLTDANNRIQQALDNLEIEQVQIINQNSEEARNIFFTDNAGKKTTLEQAYQKTHEIIAEEAKEAKEKRLNRSVSNRYQYSEIADITSEDIQIELGNAEEQNESAEIKKAIAYPIGDRNNAKAASILGSPYYQAKNWYGYFYFEMDPSVVDNWKSNNANQKSKAKSAIRLMDALVK